MVNNLKDLLAPFGPNFQHFCPDNDSPLICTWQLCVTHTSSVLLGLSLLLPEAAKTDGK